MSARDHHVAGQRPDWRGARPADTSADKRAFKRALRNYRKHVRPMTDEPYSWAESWWFIAPALVIAIVLLVAVSQGWL